MTRPSMESVPDFYKGYVLHVKDQDMLEALKLSSVETLKLVRSIPEDLGQYRYAEGKWSIKELLGHMIDTERIMSYRALRFARKDKTPLHAFEENDYAPEANAHGRTILQLSNEMERLRATTLDMFESFTPDMLNRIGMASNKLFSVLTMGYIIAGHETHHRKVLQERYITQ